MPFVTMTAPAVADPTRQAWAQLVTDNLNVLASQNSSGGGLAQLVNGSFETGTGAGDPTGWVGVRASGNTTDITTVAADVQHGLQGIKMVTPGGVAGGVTLTSDQFYNCGNGLPFGLGWFIKSTLATSSVSVQVRWYDIAGSTISTSTLYTATSGIPTSWTFMAATCVPPATAKLFKVILTGVNNTSAASVYWDGVFTFKASGINGIVYTASGTFVPSSGVTKIRYRVKGGGGGGGGRDATGAGTAGSNSWVGASGNNGRGGLAGPTGDAGTGTASQAPIFASGQISYGAYGTGHTSVNSAVNIPFPFPGGAGYANTGEGGGGGTGGGTVGGAGQHGEYAEGWYDTAGSLAVTVTVGAGGAGGGTGGVAGTAGFAIVEEVI